MSGRTSGRDDAQLAVMDALVFFAAAVLISSVVLSYSKQPADPSAPEHDSVSAALLLETVMSCSVGSNLTVDAGPQLRISQQALVRDCIAAEGGHLFRGGEPEAFADLNTIVLEMLDRCTPPMHEPHLLLVYRSYSEPLLALPHHTGDEECRVAGSVILTIEGGYELLAVLVLCPAPSPELVEV